MKPRIDLKKIKKLRKEKKFSQEHMAKILGYETATGYCYMESGRCAIDANRLLLLANTLGVKMEELFLSMLPTDLVDNDTEQAATFDKAV